MANSMKFNTCSSASAEWGLPFQKTGGNIPTAEKELELYYCQTKTVDGRKT